ncbi:hypothetical protein RPMA_15060 [Tardiphaga alba]|uniref:DUF5615 domain-containing protein n=1 Tax=Tardiphaga alba TaxID=340268 RepID=A0ABX8AC70_9BRAD|nr:hypothetical protein [Tardiphaga alba]QUS40000.1 hypothetical protein RPMA_15060 [Tardiphaga alba]
MAKMLIDESVDAEASARSKRGAVFTIHATRDDRSLTTHRIIPDIAVAQARQLNDAGWRVHISGLGGREFKPSEFYQLLDHNRIG